MISCIKCGSTLGSDVYICPICGANQSSANDVDLDNVSRKLSSSASILIRDTSEEDIMEQKLEIERLIKRGDECFKSAKAWQGAKDKSKARKEYQRAFKYYETVLRLDPNNERIREARAKCLFKMA